VTFSLLNLKFSLILYSNQGLEMNLSCLSGLNGSSSVAVLMNDLLKFLDFQDDLTSYF